MRVALFVEGTDQSGTSYAKDDPLAVLWNDVVCELAGVPAFDHVIGMSKRHLVAMNPANKGLSGVGESFDQLLVRKLTELRFDAAVVAWDLHPRWNPTAAYCRWEETLDLYRGVAASRVLSENWTALAQARLDDLEARAVPSARASRTPLIPGAIQALCMDRMFESLVIDTGASALRRALEVDGEQVPKWPNLGRSGRQHDELLGMAIEAARALRPKRKTAHKIRQGFLIEKHGWASLVLRNMLEVPEDAAALRVHPIAVRLAEIR